MLPGPHNVEGEDKEVVADSEEDDDEDSLEYRTEAPLMASYMTPPNTGGCSEPSPHLSHSPTPEGSNPENNVALQTSMIKARVEAFLAEADEDIKLHNL